MPGDRIGIACIVAKYLTLHQIHRAEAEGKGKFCSRQYLLDFPRPSASANGSHNAVETIEVFFEVHGRARADAALAAVSHSARCSVTGRFWRWHGLDVSVYLFASSALISCCF